jgi:hypothetical protein
MVGLLFVGLIAGKEYVYWERQQITRDQEKILGVTREKNWEEQRENYLKLAVKYPGHRDILLQLARINQQLGDEKMAREYFEQARILDPNNEVFK